MTKILKFAQSFIRRHAGRLSFSQCGEDLIVAYIFKAMRIKKPTYLDIGANDPKRLNNTYLFYISGCVGVSVEPDPVVYKELARVRTNETQLNVGVASKAEEKRAFYLMSASTLNTFSEDEAKQYARDGKYKIIKQENIDVITPKQIFDMHFSGSAPDFLSIDVEGLDFDILKSIDFSATRPAVICVETLTFSENNSETKTSECSSLLLSEGYFIYADTYINTIFVDKEKWTRR